MCADSWMYHFSIDLGLNMELEWASALCVCVCVGDNKSNKIKIIITSYWICSEMLWVIHSCWPETNLNHIFHIIWWAWLFTVQEFNFLPNRTQTEAHLWTLFGTLAHQKAPHTKILDCVRSCGLLLCHHQIQLDPIPSPCDQFHSFCFACITHAAWSASGQQASKGLLHA